ncbi:MAG: helix-turn-helix transcriptional regulator [Myxococcales bacterium]|nr:helix-turn-helix transcriptional regulator [Myxococcales bacterium]
MKTLAERVKWLIEDRGVDQRSFGAEAGLADSFVSALFRRARRDPKASVGAEALAAIANTWEVAPEWLLSGEGEAPVARRGERGARPEGGGEGADGVTARWVATLWEVGRGLPDVSGADYDLARRVGLDAVRALGADDEGVLRAFAAGLLKAATAVRREGAVGGSVAVLTRAWRAAFEAGAATPTAKGVARGQGGSERSKKARGRARSHGRGV